MPSRDASDRGYALIEKRVAEAPAAVERLPRLIGSLLERPSMLPRTVVTTGIGTSEGHARHLAAVANRCAGQSARFEPTGAFTKGAPPDASRDWLVVFSQGLSANARYALTDVEAWGGVVLVTGLPLPGTPGFDELDADKRRWTQALSAQGVVFVDMECGTEYGALIRVIGARVGYVLAWSILRSLAWRELRELPRLDFDSAILSAVQIAARDGLRGVFPDVERMRAFFDPNRTLVIVSHDGFLEYAQHLPLKIVEGMLRPAPTCVDVLEFSHGPLQSIAERPASILYLAASVENQQVDPDWLEAFRQTLDPELHDLRVLRSELPTPLCILEFEAIFDVLILQMLESGDADLVAWPGREREAALYDRTPAVPSPQDESTKDRQAVNDVRARAASLPNATSPEIAAALDAGCRTALVALGSIEQHGPHLPMATDAWIAQSLLERLAPRLDDAIALPPVSLGCAPEHLEFAGTLSLRASTLEAVLSDLLDSLLQHGFQRVFIWTAHGGNVDALHEMRERLASRSKSMDVHIDCDLEAVSAMQRSAVARAGRSEASAGPHAGEYETSLVAAIRRGAVRREECVPGRLASAADAQNLFYPSVKANAPTGVIGDPSGASADWGETYLEAWVDLLEANYRAAFGDPGTSPSVLDGPRGGAKNRQ